MMAGALRAIRRAPPQPLDVRCRRLRRRRRAGDRGAGAGGRRARPAALPHRAAGARGVMEHAPCAGSRGPCGARGARRGGDSGGETADAACAARGETRQRRRSTGARGRAAGANGPAPLAGGPPLTARSRWPSSSRTSAAAAAGTRRSPTSCGPRGARPPLSFWIDDPPALRGRRGLSLVLRAVRRACARAGRAFKGADVAVATGWQTVARAAAGGLRGARLPRPGPRARVLSRLGRARLGERQLSPRAALHHRGDLAGRARGGLRRLGDGLRPRHRPRALPPPRPRTRGGARPVLRARRHAAARRTARPAGARRAQAPPARGRRRALRRPAAADGALRVRPPRRPRRRTPGPRLRSGDGRDGAVADQPLAGRTGDAGVRVGGGRARHPEYPRGLRAIAAARAHAGRAGSTGRRDRGVARRPGAARTPPGRGQGLCAQRTWAAAAEQVEAGLRTAISAAAPAAP